jgi:16S rRNA (guanine527-N7)-methyltransferase
MVSRETPGVELPPWLAAHEAQLDAFGDLLAGAGVDRGLIGPREVPRIWQRHLLNCAVVVDPRQAFVASNSTVADVGSGAGLPGLVWAIVRPDLRVILIEPLLRRSTFLSEAVVELGLGARVVVRRDRAEDVVRDATWHSVDVVTARAVAPLERLLGWTIPLAKPGGRLVALKGSSAPDEVAQSQQAAALIGVRDLVVAYADAEYLEQPTTVITAIRRAAE